MALEDLASQEMAEKAHGKSINDAGWSEFIGMLSYKAEGAGSRVILVNPENTTKECSRCGVLTDKDLSERQHNCPSCGLRMDRDHNAAINILRRATSGTAVRSGDSVNGAHLNDVSFKAQIVRLADNYAPFTATGGTPGSNACEDDTSTVRQVSSMKQEAQGFSPG